MRNGIHLAISLTLTMAIGSAVALMSPLVAASDASAETSADVSVIRGATIHVGNGEVIENGTVVITDGTITAVGADVDVPAGAAVIEVDGATVTPGLIEANAMLEPDDLIVRETEGRRRNVLEVILNPTGESIPCLCHGASMCPLCPLIDEAEGDGDGDDDFICPVCGGNHAGGSPETFVSGVRPGVSLTEGSSEVVPHTSVLDAINMRSHDFDRLLAGGVTTVYASPDSAAVIGPRGAVLRTSGPFAERIVVEEADVKATVGSDTFVQGGGNRTPSRRGVSNRTRRPNSRMGVAWVFRKAFYDADKHKRGVEWGGADAPPLEAMSVLNDIRDGDVPLRIQARAARDIETAIRLADEFDLDFTLLEATEAYKCADIIKRAGVPVVFGPIFVDAPGVRSFSDETRQPNLMAFTALLDADVPTALSAVDLREEDGLARQAMYAIRSGVDLQSALTAVTLTPARLLGIDDEVGSVESGKRADLVLWSGEPFAATSRPLVVVMDGAIVLDRR